MNKLSLFFIFSIFLTLNLKATGHYPTSDIGYTSGTGTHLHAYTVNPNGRQSSLHLNAAQSGIPANADIDIYSIFSYNTTGKNIYVVYTTDGSTPTKSHGSVSFATFSYDNDPDRWWVATIPMIGTASTTVKYVIYISDGTLSASFGIIGFNGYKTSWTEGTDPGFSFTTLAALPIELMNFSVSKSGQQALLTWQTASESNNSHFDIQHSSDARTWSNIGKIEGQGTTEQMEFYTYTDKNTQAGNNYYRLKQVDYDGAFTYSPIVILNNKKQSVKVFPNPASDYFQIEFSDFKIGNIYTILLTNAQGQLISKSRSKTSLVCIKMDQLPIGLYTVSIHDKNGNILDIKQLSKI